MSASELLNGLPRTRVATLARETPAFRACGVGGYYAALAVTLGAGLLAGRSLLVLAAVAAACALSFFGWAQLRRAFVGHERYVLLEHVWVAEGAAVATLAAIGAPPLPYLDPVALGLCAFLVGGRIGCLLAGCCHGRPASIGIRYPAEAVRDGFAPELVGVRLLPVQALEAAGLALIGLAGLAALPVAAPGAVFAWFLIGYAILRFGLEGLRGDRRPHLGGLSVNRWMCLIELAVGLWVAESELGGDAAGDAAPALIVALVLLLVVALAFARRRDPARVLLAPAHRRELRELTTRSVDAAAARANGAAPPTSGVTSRGVAVAASPAHGPTGAAHVSLSLPAGTHDLGLLCELAACACPDLEATSASYSGGGVLHVLVAGRGDARGHPARTLYWAVVRRAQDREREPARSWTTAGAGG